MDAIFDQLRLRKIIKIVATRCQILRLECTKFDFAGGAYSAPPDPLALRGLLLREGRAGGEGREREGRGGEWRERRGGKEGDGKEGREGRGREGKRTSPSEILDPPLV